MASMSAITIHAPNPEVMIINLPGYEVDTHVKVFNREIHVHSIILKLNSRFFRTFMDSADKTPAPASARFKYEYDAVADSDGKTWGLEAVAKIQDQTQYKFKNSKNNESNAFANLLSCMYNHPFIVESQRHLEILVRQADFYRALPAVCKCLDGMFLRCPDLLKELALKPLDFLKLAIQVRYKPLYIDCMIYVAGKYPRVDPKPWTKLIEAVPGIDRNIKLLRADILTKVADAQVAISRLTLKPPPGNFSQPLILNDRIQHHPKLWGDRQFEYPSEGYGVGLSTLASYYRTLYNDNFTESTTHLQLPGLEVWITWNAVQSCLAPLMANKLVISPAGNVSGEGIHEDTYLCAEIEDEDIPWDLKATDW